MPGLPVVRRSRFLKPPSPLFSFEVHTPAWPSLRVSLGCLEVEVFVVAGPWYRWPWAVATSALDPPTLLSGQAGTVPAVTRVTPATTPGGSGWSSPVH